MLRVSDVEFAYGRIRALRGVSLEVNVGEVVALIGANGAGKSTLLRTIIGLNRASRGSIEFLGKEIHNMPTNRIVRAGMSLAPEGRGILGPMTVMENLEMGAYHLRTRADVEAGLQIVFGLFPHLAERKKQLAGTLSGGEQQMLAIGRALMARPKLLMMDEPSMGLAPVIVAELFCQIGRLKEEGIAILLAEQNAYKALQCANRGYVLETGRVVLEDEAGRLLNHDTVKKVYLGMA